MNLNPSDELIRKKILTILGPETQLISKAKIKLYTSTNETENIIRNSITKKDEWIYSGLEGYICYILDFKTKTRYFRLFEYVTFELLFLMDIYEKFSNFYMALDPLFHCFEINNIFIGFKFEDINKANNFCLMIKKINDQMAQMMLDTENLRTKESKKEKRKKFYENCEILKKNFGAENKYNRDYCDDGIEICKPIFYELLNFLTYNREKKEFIVGNVPKEFKNLFKNMGIKKHELKQANTTLKFFKYFIENFNIENKVNKRRITDSSVEDEEDKFEDENLNNLKNIENNSIISTSYKNNDSEITLKTTIHSSIMEKSIKFNNSPLKECVPKLPVNSVKIVPDKGIIPSAPKIKLPPIATVDLNVNLF